jgi:DNA polymerase III alpha subunit (gram-positive type)
MLLLGIDFETTGLDPQTASIIEIGAVLYCPYFKSVVQSFSVLTTAEEVPEEITSLTGITLELLQANAVPLDKAFDSLERFARKASLLVAHNADFEKSFIQAVRPQSPLLEMQTLDTMTDIPYSPHIRHRDLERLSISHNCVNSTYHRALPDVMTMFSVMSRYEWDDVMAYYVSPTREVQAIVGFDNNHLAKQCSFQWNPDRKQWLKKVKDLDMEVLQKKATEIGLKLAVDYTA